MRALLLGAGASRAASYPLASELMTTIERDAYQANSIQLRDVWNRWLSVKSAAPPELRILLDHPNPEVIFSFLDLCRLCFRKGLVERFKPDRRDEAASDALSRGEIRDDLYLSPAHAWIDKAGTAVLRLVDSLSEYLAYKQYLDVQSPSSRAYLRDLFGDLSDGDVVITLNWDAAADRSLFEIGRWSPRDGYGFEKLLVPAFSSSPADLPARILEPSKIVLLKLHGSVGWFTRNDRHLAFEPQYLQLLLDRKVDEVVLDPDQGFYPDGRPLITHPSYLKVVQNDFIRQIWWRADEVLRRADQVDIWGYSLPESDVAVSLLLAPLHWRAARGEVAVHVHDPSGEILDRYRSFFEGHVTRDKRELA